MTFSWSDLIVEPDEVTYARGRLPNRIYVSKSFPLRFSQDEGHPGRYVHKVFDEEATPDDDEDWDWTTDVVYVTPGGRKQVELQVAKEVGVVRKIRIQKVPTDPDATKLEPVLELNREQSQRLVELIRSLDAIPIEGEKTARVDDQVLRDLLADPEGMYRVYAGDPERFRALIETDAEARDVIALQNRRQVISTMRSWLDDPAVFEVAKKSAGGPEKAWQTLIEENPWILGVGLGSHLYTEWSTESLEKTVVGRNIRDVGKKVDALMRTAGVVRSMVFAEIKHHQTKLISEEYRAGCWRPSNELSGAVIQAQQTVHLASTALGDYLQDQDDDGAFLSSGTFILRPRSYVVVGSLDELTGKQGGAVRDKVRSFELFRRNLHEPEVLTFDELLARAEWHVRVAEAETLDQGDISRGAGAGDISPVDPTPV